LIEDLRGRPAVHSDEVFYLCPAPTLYLVGSILDNLARGRAVIAGAGFKYEAARILRKPLRIVAVRGRLTKEKFEAMGIACPPLYCDPGLLAARVFGRDTASAGTDVGIIPHYADQAHARASRIESHGRSYRWIDITAAPEKVVADIQDCRRIVSSSLHGIVTAHSYGIPAAWMTMSGRVGGAGFKFREYSSSIGEERTRTYDARRGIDLAEIERFCSSFDAGPLADELIGAFRSRALYKSHGV
jgi:pyruvyltransferase